MFHRNYSEYKARFSMPGDAENMFYTMELGPVKFISISTDFYYYLESGTQMAINQYNWLKKVLQVIWCGVCFQNSHKSIIAVTLTRLHLETLQKNVTGISFRE